MLFLNTDYNMDTPTKAVQKAVHTMTLIFWCFFEIYQSLKALRNMIFTSEALRLMCFACK